MNARRQLRFNYFLLWLCTFFSLASCAQADVKTSNFAIEDIGGGIYVHHGQHLDIDTGYQGDICNISFVVGSKGVAVIDKAAA